MTCPYSTRCHGWTASCATGRIEKSSTSASPSLTYAMKDTVEHDGWCRLPNPSRYLSAAVMALAMNILAPRGACRVRALSCLECRDWFAARLVLALAERRAIASPPWAGPVAPLLRGSAIRADYFAELAHSCIPSDSWRRLPK